jgi:alpha-soluble NSF attachment protein
MDTSSAERLLAEANAKLASASKSGGFFSSLSGSSKQEKYEEASDLFKDAANAFRAVRDLPRSGAAFERAAEVCQKHGDPNEAARYYTDAFKSYKEVAPNDAVRCIGKSVQLYSQKGNFRRAADLQSELSEMFERLEDLPRALQAAETAVTWYNDENIPA